eukprot:10188397-Heterocapsa_arctica.AAC.1
MTGISKKRQQVERAKALDEREKQYRTKLSRMMKSNKLRGKIVSLTLSSRIRNPGQSKLYKAIC